MSVPVSARSLDRAAWVERGAAVLARPWVWVGALSVLGFLLRRYHLGDESLWFDEADIVRRAGQSLPTLLGNFTQAGENGPLYTLLLHFWLSAIKGAPLFARALHLVFGHNDEALVRGLSAVFGACAIPLMYLFGERVGGRTLGFIAAILLTFNPFHIWYSQDAKMYTLLVLLSLASSLLYLEALEEGKPRLWAGYVACTWVMLAVHGMAGLVLLAQLAATPFLGVGGRGSAVGRIAPRSWLANPRWVAWGWAMLLVLVPLFPVVWLRAAAVFTGTADVGGWYTPTGLGDILSTILVKFAVNQADPPWETVGSIVMLVLALAGASWLFFTRRARTAPGSPGSPVTQNSKLKTQNYLLALWLVPVLAFWLVTLQIPLFQPRYLIMALPPYLVFASAGLLALRRIHPSALLAGALVLAVPTAAALSAVNYSSQVQKEDWRGAMSYVQDHLRLRDVVVVFPGYLVTAVNYYYKPGRPSHVPQVDVKTIPSLRTKGFGDAELDAALRDAVTCHERAWFITSPPRELQEDPLHEVQDWFQYNWHTFDTRVYNGVTVYGISFDGQPNCWYPPPDYKERHTFVNGLKFLGYIYELRDDETAQPDASYFPLTIYWRNLKKLDQDLIIRIMIKDPSGKMVVDEALGPLNGYRPTTHWPPDTPVIDYRDLRLPGGLSSGDYHVSLQVYPTGHPDQPIKLDDGSTQIDFQAPLPVVPWKP